MQHNKTQYIFFHAAIQHKRNLILAADIWQIGISVGQKCITSVNEARHLFFFFHTENINSTCTNTAVATTAGLPALFEMTARKKERKNDGEASASSELFVTAPSAWHNGSDCHVAHVRHNSRHRHPVEMCGWTYAWRRWTVTDNHRSAASNPPHPPVSVLASSIS